MTKYSADTTGTPDPNSDDASCALCGSTENLTSESIAGTDTVICQSCRKNGDNNGRDRNDENDDSSSGFSSSSSSTPKSDESSGYTITDPDPSWVDDGLNYQEDTTPYLDPNYESTVTESMENESLSPDDLADKVGLNTDTVRAIANGEAVSAGVGASAISAVENYLAIDIIDSR